MFEWMKRKVNETYGDMLIPAKEIAAITRIKKSDTELAKAEKLRSELPKIIKAAADAGFPSIEIDLLENYDTNDDNEHLTCVIGWLKENGYTAYTYWHYKLVVGWGCDADTSD